MLATGNKSELSVGYCTFYGDTVGGLAVLGDVYKRDVYALARHANRAGERVPRHVIDKPPSAELAPDSSGKGLGHHRIAVLRVEMATECAQVLKRCACRDDDRPSSQDACPPSHFDTLAAGANPPHGRPFVHSGTADGRRFRQAQTRAKRVECEAARADGGAILNNNYFGMVRQWQELFYNRNYSATSLSTSPDFVKLAEAYGAIGLRATKPAEVAPTIEKALQIHKPVVIDFQVDAEEGVYPMVPSGASINNMILL